MKLSTLAKGFVLCVLLNCSWVISQGQGPNSPVRGAGTTGYIARWTNTKTLGKSMLFQDSGGNIGLGTATPLSVLDVNGAVAGSSFNIGTNPFAFGSYNLGNAFVGFAGNFTMFGEKNTAVGGTALGANTSGYFNTAVGYRALASNTEGTDNTAIGLHTLQYSNSYANTAVGAGALDLNTTGQLNTAIGYSALLSNTTGTYNTAGGAVALAFNTTGSMNTAMGEDALAQNTTGNANTASGNNALGFNTTGAGNTAMGFYAFKSNTGGNYNTALGYGADVTAANLTNATAVGANAIVGQSNSLVLGGTGSYAVRVGIGTATPSNVFTIARGAGHAVADSWDTYSSRRWKINIHTLHGAIETIQQLRGVSYDSMLSGKHEIGVIAEEVGGVIPEVVSWEKNGRDARGIDYGRLTALLIEATKEQQVLIQQQANQIKAQQAEIGRLTSQMKAIKAALNVNPRNNLEFRVVKAHIVQ